MEEWAFTLRVKRNGLRYKLSQKSLHQDTEDSLESRHLHCVCNIKIQCEEVKNTTSLYM